MKLVGLTLVVVAVIGGCSSGPGAKSTTTAKHEHVEPPPDPCVEADAVMASGKKLAEAGHLYRALEAAGYAKMLCDKPRAARALDQALADLDITSAMLAGAQPRFNVGHDQGAAAELALSADGSTAVSLSTNGELVLWNAATGRQLLHIETGQKDSWTMGATRDLARVATGDNKGNVKVWDLVHGKLLAEWKLNTRSASALAFDPTGERLAAAGVDYDVVVYEAKSGRELRRGKVEAWIRALRYTHDGKGILVATDKALHLVDAESLSEIWKAVPGGQLLALDLSADGKRVAVGGRTAATTVYDVATGEKLSEHRGLEGRIESVAVSADGVRVAAAADRAITLWDGTNPKGRSVAGGSLAISLSPDGAILYVATSHALSRFDAATGEALRGGLGGPVSSVVFNPRGTQLAVIARESIAIWNIEKPISVRTLAQRLTTHAAFDSSGKTLATGTVTGKVVLWNTSTGKATRSFSTELGAVAAVAFSPDDSRLAAAGKKGIEIWSTATWRLERSLEAEVSQLGGLAFGPGGRLAALNGPYNVTVWDAATGATKDDQKLVSIVPRTIVFRGDGALVIAGSYGFLAIRDVDAEKNIQILSKRGYAFTKATFARNGEWLLAVQAGFKTEPMVRFWNGKTGQPLRGVEMEGNWVRAIGINPDGTRLVAGRADGTLTLWDVGTGKVLGHALSSADGNWAAISADGEVDGSTGRNGGHTLVHWDADGVIVPGAVRWSRKQRPGHWVAALMSSDREAASVSETMAKTGDPTWVEGERILDSQRYLTAGQTVRLREKPDPGAKELGVVFAGDRMVQIAEHPSDRGWLKIEYDDKKGWVRDVTARRGLYVTSRLTQAQPTSATGQPRELPPGTLIAPIRWLGGEVAFELDGVEWKIPTDAANRSKDDVAVGKVFERARHARELGRNDDITSSTSSSRSSPVDIRASRTRRCTQTAPVSRGERTCSPTRTAVSTCARRPVPRSWR